PQPRGAAPPHAPRKKFIGWSGINNDEVEPARLFHRLRIERELQLGRADNLRREALPPELNPRTRDGVGAFDGHSDRSLALWDDERLDRVHRWLRRARRIRHRRSARSLLRLRTSTESDFHQRHNPRKRLDDRTR